MRHLLTHTHTQTKYPHNILNAQNPNEVMAIRCSVNYKVKFTSFTVVHNQCKNKTCHSWKKQQAGTSCNH